jgi:hypothetical protein
MTEEKPLTEGLPLSVRVSLARAWLLAVACERSLNGQPRDCLNYALWEIDFVTEDLVDVGRDAFENLDGDLQIQLVTTTADEAMICTSCLGRLVWPESFEEEDGTDD